MALSDKIDGETAEDFKRRVEQFYGYTFKPGETWCLFDKLLVVAHPDRAPILVHEGGRIEEVALSAGDAP